MSVPLNSDQFQERTHVPDINTSEIWDIVQRIKKDFDKKIMSNKKLGTKYKDFVQKYPHVFLMITEKKCDMKRLKNMLSLIKQVQKGDLTIHQADTNIGKSYADEFIPKDLKE